MVIIALQFLRSQATFRADPPLKTTRYGTVHFHTTFLFSLSWNKTPGRKVDDRLYSISLSSPTQIG